ncbi:MAG: phosphoribosylpyrophosphate synthetase [Cyclobacteriaceae bacterium]|nr:phosphoribosylpyrophosphate synthetase [Cyclobacteriaceae bacterium]
MRGLETLSEVLNDLSLRGYTLDFSLHSEKDCLICRKTTRHLSSDEFDVDEYYRFEKATDSRDEVILYALSSSKYNVKGVVVNTLGIYANGSTSKIVEKLKQSLAHDEVD